MAHSNSTKANDPLYPWKKHSGFKKGLATDIIMGDVRKWTGNAQFATTMHTDYDLNQLDLYRNPVALAQHQREQRAHLDPSVYVPDEPAGKPLGAHSSHSRPETHISFGDYSMENKARFESLTAQDFAPPPRNREVTGKNRCVVDSSIVTSKPGTIQESKFLTPIQKHHSRPLMATSAAHIGLQTRQDLPIDDKHFKSFSTSNSEAYANFQNHIKAMAKEEPTSFKPKVTNRLSNIQQGDHRGGNYLTMHDDSYVQHPSDAYQHHRLRVPGTHTSIVLGHKNTAPRWKSEPDDMYTSTSAAAYQSRENIEQDISFASKVVRGKSYIVFGEPDKVMSNPSVTQRDYHEHDLNLLTRPIDLSKKQVLVQSSIASALAPDGRASWREAESCTSSSYRGQVNHNEDSERSAGIDLGSRETTSDISSIPFGDPEIFHLATFKTTNTDDFKVYPRTHVEHPILGAKITKSRVTFGEPGGAMDMQPEERYLSTTHNAFVQHPESVAVLGRGVPVKPRVTLNAGEDIDTAYSMGNNKTTHAAHYQAPPQDRVHGLQDKLVPRKSVPRKMLFPLRSHQPGIFGTVTSDSFGMRNGLLFSESDSKLKKEQKSSLRQLRTKSSIAFGDPHLLHFNEPQGHVVV